MRRLLRTLPEGEPSDCLLARIMGRRSFLVVEWERLLTASQPLAGLPEAPWRAGVPPAGDDRFLQALHREYAWVFLHMAESLRVILTPVFWMAELRTLAICLRNRSGGREADGQVLRHSLLRADIAAELSAAPDAAAMVTFLAGRLAACHPGFARLPDEFQHGGCAGVEIALNDISLEACAATTTHPLMKRFLALSIDSRNLTAIAKRLRWRQGPGLRLLPGGTVRPQQLEQLFEQGDAAGVAALAARLGRHPPTDDQDRIEQTLLESLGHAVRRMAREAADAGIIIDYLWRLGAEARNLGLLSRLSLAGVDAVDRELVR